LLVITGTRNFNDEILRFFNKFTPVKRERVDMDRHQEKVVQANVKAN
jgi:hypothetical protein